MGLEFNLGFNLSCIAIEFVCNCTSIELAKAAPQKRLLSLFVAYFSHYRRRGTTEQLLTRLPISSFKVSSVRVFEASSFQVSRFQVFGFSGFHVFKLHGIKCVFVKLRVRDPQSG